MPKAQVIAEGLSLAVCNIKILASVSTFMLVAETSKMSASCSQGTKLTNIETFTFLDNDFQNLILSG